MDKYRIYSEVGRGEHCKVYKGRERQTVKYVAIKSVVKQQQEKVLHEVRMMFTLNHPNILRFVNWYVTKQHLWLILEYCTGGSLKSLLSKDTSLPESAVRMFGVDLVHALHYLHSNKIIFCDLKPSNILLNEFGVLKLSDFALARSIPESAESSGKEGFEGKSNADAPDGHTEASDRQPSQHSTSRFSGTPCYMAPELFLDDGVHSFASDLWSLGCVLYELAVGRPPFYSSSLQELVRMIQHDQLEMESLNAAGQDGVTLSAVFQDLLTGLLQKDPIKRMPWSSLLTHAFWEDLPVPSLGVLPTNPAFQSYIENRLKTLNSLQTQTQAQAPFGSNTSLTSNPPGDTDETQRLFTDTGAAQYEDASQRESLEGMHFEDKDVHNDATEDKTQGEVLHTGHANSFRISQSAKRDMLQATLLKESSETYIKNCKGEEGRDTNLEVRHDGPRKPGHQDTRDHNEDLILENLDTVLDFDDRPQDGEAEGEGDDGEVETMFSSTSFPGGSTSQPHSNKNTPEKENLNRNDCVEQILGANSREGTADNSNGGNRRRGKWNSRPTQANLEVEEEELLLDPPNRAPHLSEEANSRPRTAPHVIGSPQSTYSSSTYERDRAMVGSAARHALEAESPSREWRPTTAGQVRKHAHSQTNTRTPQKGDRMPQAGFRHNHEGPRFTREKVAFGHGQKGNPGLEDKSANEVLEHVPLSFDDTPIPTTEAARELRDKYAARQTPSIPLSLSDYDETPIPTLANPPTPTHESLHVDPTRPPSPMHDAALSSEEESTGSEEDQVTAFWDSPIFKRQAGAQNNLRTRVRQRYVNTLVPEDRDSPSLPMHLLLSDPSDNIVRPIVGNPANGALPTLKYNQRVLGFPNLPVEQVAEMPVADLERFLGQVFRALTTGCSPSSSSNGSPASSSNSSNVGAPYIIHVLGYLYTLCSTPRLASIIVSSSMLTVLIRLCSRAESILSMQQQQQQHFNHSTGNHTTSVPSPRERSPRSPRAYHTPQPSPRSGSGFNAFGTQQDVSDPNLPPSPSSPSRTGALSMPRAGGSTPGSLSSKALVRRVRVRVAIIVAVLIRHATFIAPRLGEEGLLTLFISLCEESYVPLRRYGAAGLGELLFYITANASGSVSQDGDSSPANLWKISGKALKQLFMCLRSENETIRLYAAKTYENVLCTTFEMIRSPSTPINHSSTPGSANSGAVGAPSPGGKHQGVATSPRNHVDGVGGLRVTTAASTGGSSSPPGIRFATHDVALALLDAAVREKSELLNRRLLPRLAEKEGWTFLVNGLQVVHGIARVQQAYLNILEMVLSSSWPTSAQSSTLPQHSPRHHGQRLRLHQPGTPGSLPTSGSSTPSRLGAERMTREALFGSRSTVKGPILKCLIQLISNGPTLVVRAKAILVVALVLRACPRELQTLLQNRIGYVLDRVFAKLATILDDDDLEEEGHDGDLPSLSLQPTKVSPRTRQAHRKRSLSILMEEVIARDGDSVQGTLHIRRCLQLLLSTIEQTIDELVQNTLRVSLKMGPVIASGRSIGANSPELNLIQRLAKEQLPLLVQLNSSQVLKPMISCNPDLVTALSRLVRVSVHVKQGSAAEFERQVMILTESIAHHTAAITLSENAVPIIKDMLPAAWRRVVTNRELDAQVLSLRLVHHLLAVYLGTGFTSKACNGEQNTVYQALVTGVELFVETKVLPRLEREIENGSPPIPHMCLNLVGLIVEARPQFVQSIAEHSLLDPFMELLPAQEINLTDVAEADLPSGHNLEGRLDKSSGSKGTVLPVLQLVASLIKFREHSPRLAEYLAKNSTRLTQKIVRTMKYVYKVVAEEQRQIGVMAAEVTYLETDHALPYETLNHTNGWGPEGNRAVFPQQRVWQSPIHPSLLGVGVDIGVGGGAGDGPSQHVLEASTILLQQLLDFVDAQSTSATQNELLDSLKADDFALCSTLAVIAISIDVGFRGSLSHVRAAFWLASFRYTEEPDEFEPQASSSHHQILDGMANQERPGKIDVKSLARGVSCLKLLSSLCGPLVWKRVLGCHMMLLLLASILSAKTGGSAEDIELLHEARNDAIGLLLVARDKDDNNVIDSLLSNDNGGIRTALENLENGNEDLKVLTGQLLSKVPST